MAAAWRVEFCLGKGIRAADGWDGMQWDDIIFTRFILLWDGSYGGILPMVIGICSLPLYGLGCACYD